jgi:hypothetical protein
VTDPLPALTDILPGAAADVPAGEGLSGGRRIQEGEMTVPAGSQTDQTGLVQPLDTLRAALNRLRGQSLTWRHIRASYFPGVPAGTLCAVARGREPRKPEIRRALGLPVDPVILATPRVCACGCGISYVPIVPHQRRLPGHPRRRAVDRN